VRYKVRLIILEESPTLGALINRCSRAFVWGSQDIHTMEKIPFLTAFDRYDWRLAPWKVSRWVIPLDFEKQGNSFFKKWGSKPSSFKKVHIFVQAPAGRI
jgi:hypothetical protein